MDKFYECPKCGDEVPVDLDWCPKEVTCNNCNATLSVDYDAELINGSWKDRTTLQPTTQPNL